MLAMIFQNALRSKRSSSSLADDRLAMMTGHVMKPDPVIVEVVEDSQAGLVALPVVWLGAASSGNKVTWTWVDL